MSAIANDLRFALIKALWKLPGVSRKYCWAHAVAWSVGHGGKVLKVANHKCYYCLACHTDEEIEEYQKS